MKPLFCFIAIIASTTIDAQDMPLQRKAPKTYQPPPVKTSEWLDTTHMYASKYGKIARLKQDNMPCVIPYPGGKMLNVYSGKDHNSKMPNLWKKDSANRK